MSKNMTVSMSAANNKLLTLPITNQTRQTILFCYAQIMKNSTWQLQEAKSRFSELVETVIMDGAQIVTKHGKPTVVVISAEEYHRTIAPQKSLAAALRACPDDLSVLLGKKKKQLARNIKID